MEDMSSHRSLFPVPAISCSKDHSFATEQIFWDSGQPDLPSRNLFRAAWALLLRAYLRNDRIAFLELGECHIDNLFHGCPIANKEIHYGASKLQFEINSATLVHNISPARVVPLRETDFVDTEVNTALNIMWGKQITENETPNAFLLKHGPRILLCLEIEEQAAGLRFLLHYRSSYFSKQYIRTVASTFLEIWTGVQDQESTVQGIEMVGSESKSIMKLWNPEDLFCQRSCMHYLVEAVARANPEKEAVCAWDGSLTYSELDRYASQAAALLINCGVKRGDFVPLGFEKSCWTVVAALAILKAGGAFVPLEPTHPRTRLQGIIELTGAKLVVTSEMWQDTFREMASHVFVVSLRTFSSKTKCEPSDFLSVASDPTDPIFVLFTSGSTGKPKGMVLEHAAICTHAIAHGEAMGFRGARVLQFAAHTFDVAIMDIFTTLIFGGCICVPSEDERRTDITGAINRFNANYAILTPSYAGLIDPGAVPSLKTLAIGGEALSQDRVDRWCSSVSLIQIYGPAEVGICLLTHMAVGKTRPETVGRPLHNCSCWLVDPDDYHRLVPIGAVGELLVASPSLARGYLQDRQKTRDLFIENPAFAIELGLLETRFYRTGDLLRYNLNDFDGSFDFIGRKDYQIKLRGQRLEPAEIEQHISAMSFVALSVVMKVEQGFLAGELVAVIQMRNQNVSRLSSDPPTITIIGRDQVSDMKERLSRVLPAYMIPSRFVAVDHMPRVPSLKIDRPAIRDWLHKLGGSQDGQPSPLDTFPDFASALEPHEKTALDIGKKISAMVTSRTGQENRLAGYNFAINDIGLDSIQVIGLGMFIRHRFNKMLPMDILSSPSLTLRILATFIDADSIEKLEYPARQDLGFRVQKYREKLFRQLGTGSVDIGAKNPTAVRHILLTGGTGFLGIAILEQLLVQPQNFLYLLVRCNTASSGLQRVISAASSAGWWNEAFLSRLQIWPGDLSKRDLGLIPTHLQSLQGVSTQILPNIDSVIHNGARVHYGANFESLAGANIDSTITLLRIMAKSPYIRNFLYIAGGRRPEINPLSFSDTCISLQSQSGYAQTKFVAEHLMESCISSPSFRNREIIVLKPGYIIGSLRDGKASQTDFIWRLAACCLEIGAFNIDEIDHWLFIGDITQIAQRARSLALDGARTPDGSESLNRGQVLTGLRFRDFWRQLQEELGCTMVGLSGVEWVNLMTKRVLKIGEIHPMFPLLHILDQDGRNLGSKDGPGEEHEIATDVLCRNIKYLASEGFFSASRH